MTKEEKEKILKAKKALLASKEREFKEIGEPAHREWVDFCPCLITKEKVKEDSDGNRTVTKTKDFCPFLSSKCHKTCGVVMKWMWNLGKVEVSESFGNSNRIVSLMEKDDYTAFRPGVADEIDKMTDEVIEEVAADDEDEDEDDFN